MAIVPPPKLLNGNSRFQLTHADSLDRARACLKFIGANWKHFGLLEIGVNNLRERVIAARMVQLEGKQGTAFVIEYPLQRELPEPKGIPHAPVDMKYFIHYQGEETLAQIAKKDVDSLNVADEKGVVVFARREEQAYTYALSHFESMGLPIGRLANRATATLMCHDTGLTVTAYVAIGDLAAPAV